MSDRYKTVRHMIALNCSEQTKHALEEYCEKHNISQSQFVREAVDARLKQEGFVPSPLPIKTIAPIEDKPKKNAFTGPEYTSLRAYLMNRRMDVCQIDRTCRVKYLFKSSNISDNMVLRTDSLDLLNVLRVFYPGKIPKNMGANIRWYQTYLNQSMGAIGDDLTCEKEATA